jgi:uncharacterized protein YggE
VNIAGEGQGQKLGGPRAYGREAKQAAVERAKALAPLFEELVGKSAREVARILNARNVDTPTGKPWSAMTVIRVRDRLAAA